MSAFEELYKQYYRQVYFYVLGLCRSEYIAEKISPCHSVKSMLM